MLRIIEPTCLPIYIYMHMGCHVVLPEHCLLPESFLKENHIFIHAILADDATAGSTTVQIELLALFHEDVIVTYVLGSKHGVSSVSSMRCMVHTVYGPPPRNGNHYNWNQ